MVRRISSREARANFSELLRIVHYTKEPVIVQRNGRPFAVVIGPEQFETLSQEIERAWTTLDRLRERNADKDPDEVLEDVTAVVEQVRQERYEKDQQARAAKRRR